MYILTILLVSLPIITPLTCNCTRDQDDCNSLGICTTAGLCVGQLVLSTIPTITQKCIPISELASTCNVHVPPSPTRYCCSTDLCNNITAVIEYLGITTAYTHSTTISSQNSNTTTTAATTALPLPSALMIALSVLGVLLLLSIAFVLVPISIMMLICCWRYKRYRRSPDYIKALHLHEEVNSELDSTYGSGSGSGAGMAQLSQVTVARQVRKELYIVSWVWFVTRSL